jgi:hypothetical protein
VLELAGKVQVLLAGSIDEIWFSLQEKWATGETHACMPGSGVKSADRVAIYSCVERDGVDP